MIRSLKVRKRRSNYGRGRYGWKIEDLKKGFEKFHKEYGRYPLSSDLEKSSKYLPSSRWLQYKFGGIIGLRKKLGLRETDYSSGSNRRRIANVVNTRSKSSERTIYETLSRRFGIMFVHKEWEIERTRKRIDFYVFTKSGDFGVDVFYTTGRHNLSIIINLKNINYKGFQGDLYFVSANDEIEQPLVDDVVENRKTSLDKHTKVLTTKNFFKYIRNLEPYKVV